MKPLWTLILSVVKRRKNIFHYLAYLTDWWDSGR